GCRPAYRLSLRSRHLGSGGRLLQAALEDLCQGGRDHGRGLRQYPVRRQSRLRLHRRQIVRHADGALLWLESPAWSPLAFADMPVHGAPMDDRTASGEGGSHEVGVVRHDWTREEVRALFALPFPELIFHAQRIHRLHFDATEVQMSTLTSIKTGGCPEDCAYCPQGAHYETGVKAEKLMRIDAVIAEARSAKSAGASRFCMGAAWREPKDRDLDQVCDMVQGVKAVGLETCATLGMLTQPQARRLKAAGLDYYNHNLATSPEYYGAIITTRTYP